MPVTVLDHELQEMYDVALQVAKKAGELIKQAFEKEKSVEFKENPADLVTETDKMVEKVTFDLIRVKFPNHKFIGEETQSESGGHCEWTDDPTWIIDPVDGTTNFVHTVQEVCFSLGITVNKQPVIAVVNVPMKGEMFTARAGMGAFLNGQKLRANKTTDLKKSLVVTEAGTSRDAALLADKVKNMHSLIKHSHGVRCYGSAAYNLCCVAAGRGDLYYEFGIHIWDIVAGCLVALEAGATSVDPSGSEIDYLARSVLCTCTPDLVKQVSALLIQIDSGRD